MTNFDPWPVAAVVIPVAGVALAWLRYRTMKLFRIPEISVDSHATGEDGLRQAMSVCADTSGSAAKWLVRKVALKRPRRLRISAPGKESPWKRSVRFHPPAKEVGLCCRMDPSSDRETLKMRVVVSLSGKPFTRRRLTVYHELRNWPAFYRQAERR